MQPIQLHLSQKNHKAFWRRSLIYGKPGFNLPPSITVCRSIDTCVARRRIYHFIFIEWKSGSYCWTSWNTLCLRWCVSWHSTTNLPHNLLFLMHRMNIFFGLEEPSISLQNFSWILHLYQVSFYFSFCRELDTLSVSVIMYAHGFTCIL